MARLKPTLEEFDEALKPDKHSLDEEWERNGQLVYHAYRASAEAIRTKQEIEIELKRMSVEIEERMREQAGEKRITEAALARKLSQVPIIVALKKKLADAELEVASWEGMKIAYTQRYHSLRGLSEIFLRTYYQPDSYQGGSARREMTDIKAAEIRRRAGEVRHSDQIERPKRK